MDPLVPYHLPVQAPNTLYRAHFVYKGCNRVHKMSLCSIMSLVKNRLQPGLLLWNPWPHITYQYTYRHYVLYLRCSRVYFAYKTCYRAYFAYKTVIEPILTIRPSWALLSAQLCIVWTPPVDHLTQYNLPIQAQYTQYRWYWDLLFCLKGCLWVYFTYHTWYGTTMTFVTGSSLDSFYESNMTGLYTLQSLYALQNL